MIGLVTALGSERWEPALIGALVAPTSEVSVVRRCVDATDLTAVVIAGLAEVVIVGPRLPRLDLGAIELIAASGVPILGVHGHDDELGADRLRQLGVASLVPVEAADAPASASAVALAAAELRRQRLEPVAADYLLAGPVRAAAGQLIAVLGAAGSPGRTTLALSLGAHATSLGSVLVVDADASSPSAAAMLGVLVDESGLARACRSVSEGGRVVGGVLPLSVNAGSGLRLLTGATHPLRPTAVARVLGACLEEFDTVVVDTPPWSGSESDASTIVDAVLGCADVVVVVGSADPVGLVRVLPLLHRLAADAPQAQHVVVLNRVRPSALGGAEEQLTHFLGGLVELPQVHYLPHDVEVCDNAVLRGVAVSLAAGTGKLGKALSRLSASVIAPASETATQPAASAPVVSAPVSLAAEPEPPVRRQGNRHRLHIPKLPARVSRHDEPANSLRRVS